MLVCLLRRHLEEERLNRQHEEEGAPTCAVFGTRERRAPARLSLVVIVACLCRGG
jgi:hypothetical protein